VLAFKHALPVVAARLLHAPEIDPAFLRHLLQGDEQIVDRLVAVGGNGDALAAAKELGDDVRAGGGLAGAGRPLDEQGAPVQAGVRLDGLLLVKLVLLTSRWLRM
jgi:hypothetical protein